MISVTKRTLICATFLVLAVIMTPMAAMAQAGSYANFEGSQTNPIRLSADGTRLFAVNTANASLSVFNVTTPSSPTLLAQVPVGLGPVSVNTLNDNLAWVVNQVSNSISVVAPVAGSWNNGGIVTSTIYLKVPLSGGNGTSGGEPMDVVFAGALAYVSVSRAHAIAVIDTAALKVTDTWSIAPCEEPSGLAFDVAHKRLFAGCHNKMMVAVDSSNGKAVGNVPIGEGVDADAFDPATAFAFASCGDGTITVAHEDSPDKLSLVDTIHTQRGARTMALDTSNHNIYTVTADFMPMPAPTPDNPRPRPSFVPGSFTLLIYTR